MVAYSFKRQFAERIRAGEKCQTIRADRNRHARAGETVQLYTGMRTNQCMLIGKATCLAVSPIRMDFAKEVIVVGARRPIKGIPALDEFARADGFDDFLKMRDFWRDTHGPTGIWEGMLIEWTGFQMPPEVR